MKTKTTKSDIKNYSDAALRICAEPFLVVGITLFWAIALPIAALYFAAHKAIEQVLEHLSAPAPANARLTRHAA